MAHKAFAMVFEAQGATGGTQEQVSCSVLQCVAVCCSVLQCAAVCYSVLQCAALCYSVCSARWYWCHTETGV